MREKNGESSVPQIEDLIYSQGELAYACGRPIAMGLCYFCEMEENHVYTSDGS